MKKCFFVYILTNYTNNVFYIGIRSNLIQRVWQHKKKLVEGFTNKYHLWKLVYYEVYEDANTALAREKQLKNWRREKKLMLIKRQNPTFQEIIVD